MPRRYGADGTRLWNGKTPEEFTEADAYRFMAETEAVLQRKELMDDPAQPAPASGKEEFYLSKKDDVLLTPEQIAAEERRWLFDAPIAELAEVKGVSIDEAVKMRTDAVLQEAVVHVVMHTEGSFDYLLLGGSLPPIKGCFLNMIPAFIQTERQIWLLAAALEIVLFHSDLIIVQRLY